jgi:hypothetical protein
MDVAMTKEFQPLDKGVHSELKIKPGLSFAHLEGQNVVPLVAQEFGFASANFPVMFVKDPNNGEFRSVGILGVEEGENLVFTPEKVNATYIPMDIQRYPFAVARDDENQRLVLCVDVKSDLLADEGEAIISEDGTLGARAERSQEIMKQYVEQEAVTRELLRVLDEYELIAPAQVRVTLEGESRLLNGLYRVDDKKVQELSDDKVLELHRRNYFPAIFAHLQSLAQLQVLIDLKAAQQK